jgi:tyrosyl-tRNA synthetase
MEGIVKVVYELAKVNDEIDVISFLAETSILPSKGEAKKMIQNGGIQINRNKVEDLQMKLNASMLLHSKYLLVQKGKKNYYLVEVM